MLLAGGAAKLPRVQSAVRSLFSEADVGQPDVPPDEAAALGAGAQAALLAFRSDGTPVVDRKGRKARYPRAQALAVSALPCTESCLRADVGSRKVQLVPSGAALPFECKSKVTAPDGEPFPEQLRVLEGDCEVATMRVPGGKGATPEPEAARELRIDVAVDIQGAVRLRVLDTKSGLEEEAFIAAA